MPNNLNEDKMVNQRLTVREIRMILYETNKFTVIGSDERTNQESRDFLFEIDNQDYVFNVIDKGNHLLIWA